MNTYVIVTKKHGVKIMSVMLAAAIILVIIAVVTPYMYRAVVLVKSAGAVCATDRSSGEISLTFDISEGEWGEGEHLPDILSQLRENNAKCTFFVTGEWAQQFPDAVNVIVADGHEIMNGGRGGEKKADADRAETTAFICEGADIIHSLTGIYPMLLRLSNGKYQSQMLQIAESLNMTVVKWDVDSMDAKGVTEDVIASRVNSLAQSGSIVRFSGLSRATLDALPEIFQSLSEKNLSCIRVSDMLYTDYILDKDGRQLAR